MFVGDPVLPEGSLSLFADTTFLYLERGLVSAAKCTLTAALVGRGAHRYTSSLSQSLSRYCCFTFGGTETNVAILIKSQ